MKIGKQVNRNRSGFTIIELLIVIVVIAILAAITVTAFNGVQARARDNVRINKIKDIAKALELYKVDNGFYPKILDGNSVESNCGSEIENWGHCDRNKQLSDAIAPYMDLDPVSLSSATQGIYTYYYTSQPADDYQTYGMKVILEGSGGQNDGGYFANAYEVGPKPSYCMSKYSGADASWIPYTTLCVGGN